MMNCFKSLYLSIFLLIAFDFTGQNWKGCAWHNSSVNPNYCCGHDPLLKTQLKSHAVLGDNYCDDKYFDKVNVYNAYAIPGDWFLIWYDEFDYGTLDESFYRPDYGWGNHDIQKHPSAVAIPENVKLINGKLVLVANYNPDPNKLYKNFGSNWDNSITCYPCPDKHFDYTVSAVKTHMAFPINSRYHTNLKMYPHHQQTWPALWLRGDHAYEIDIFELVFDNTDKFTFDDIHPESSLKMSYHSTRYGGPETSTNGPHAEGIHHDVGLDMGNTFNNYDLIWDKWKIDWYFNSNVVNQATRHYFIPSSWTSSTIKKNYRANPMKDYNSMVSHLGGSFMINKYFLDNNIAQNLIFNVSVKAGVTPSSVGPGKTQEMDNLTIWLRADCNATKLVSSNNPVPSPDNPSKSSYELGKIVRTVTGVPFNIPSGYFAIYAATQSVELLDGFSVDQDANFFAFISSCGGAWDHRMGSDYELNEPKYDIIEDIPDDSDIKEYSTQTTFNSETRHDILLKNFETSFSLVCNTGTLYDIEIYNVQGALVFSKYNNTTNEIEISKELIAPGIYMAKSTTPAGVDVRKLWIIR